MIRLPFPGGRGARGEGEPFAPAKSMDDSSLEQSYWLQTRRLTGVLLLIWFLVTFVGAYFARDLRFTFLGWPFSFYMAAQGSLLIYLLIVFFYARWQRTRDLDYARALAAADRSADEPTAQ